MTGYNIWLTKSSRPEKPTTKYAWVIYKDHQVK